MPSKVALSEGSSFSMRVRDPRGTGRVIKRVLVGRVGGIRVVSLFG